MQSTLSRTTPPSLQPIKNISIKQIEKSSLDNGIPVYIMNAGTQEVINVELIFMNPSFNVKEPLLANATNRLLSEGTSKHNARQLADMVDYYGSFYETSQSADYCTVSLHTLTKHLESTLPVVHEIITDAAFPEKELGVYKQVNKQRLTVENEKVQSIARRKFAELIFGQNHSYGYMVQLTDYDNLNSSGLKSFHKTHYTGNHCRIIISGKIDGNVIPNLNKVFGGGEWIKGNGEAHKSEGIQSAKEKKYFIEKEDAVQSAIRIGKPLFNKTHHDYAGIQVLNTVLGGYFGSRLMTNIREEKGYTYGIGSAAASMIHGGYFVISSEVGADVCSAAITEIYKEVNLLKKELVDEEELSMVKNYILGSFLKSIDGAFNLADRWKGLMFYNLDYDYYDRFINTVKNITAEELMQLAQKYFDESSFYELVVGKR